MLTIRKAMSLPALDCAKVVAGHKGLDKKIEWFHTVDIPQILPWVKKGDMLITVSYALHTTPEAMDGLVENLNEKGVVGLIMTVGLYLKEVPKQMIEAADRLGFPIITLTADHHLRDITRQLSEQILLGREVFSDYAVWNQKTMEIVRRGDSLCGLTRLAAEVLNSQVVLLDGFGRPLSMGREYGEYIDDLLVNFREVCLRKAASRSGLPELGLFNDMHYFYYRLQTRNQEIAFLVVLKNIECIDLSRLMLIQNIATIMSALVSSKEVVQKAICNAHIPLLENILYGQYASNEIACREAFKLGWDLNSEHVVVVFEVVNFDKYIVEHQLNEPEINKYRADIIKTVSQRITYIQGKYPVIKQDLKFTTIFQLSNRSSLNKIIEGCSEIVDELNERFKTAVFVGISSAVNDLASFCICLNESNEVLKIIKTLNDKKIAKYDELNMELILYKIFKDEDIKKAHIKKITRLVEYDEKYNSNLVYTLQNYVRDQGNLALTARNMDIHRNTVKYRLRKSEELLGMDFSVPGAFLNLAILLKVSEVSDEKGKGLNNAS